jgi:biopolymer transport protein ExbD
MGVRLTKSGWVGIALIVIPLIIYVSYECWLSTREFTPLDLPILISENSAATANFEVNLAGRYTFSIATDYNFPNRLSECRGEQRESAITTHWTLLGPDGVTADVTGDYFAGWGGAADLRKTGHYFLRAQILGAPTCLNAAHPRLKVETWNDAYAAYRIKLQWLCLVLVTCGAGLILRAISQAVIGFENPLRDSPLTAVAGDLLSSHAPQRQIPRLSGLPSFGIVASLVLLFLVISMYVMQIRLETQGIYVRLVRSNEWRADLSPEPLIIRLESKWTGRDSTYRWFLNSKEIKREGLATELRKQLALRPKWIVYVEADTNSAYGVALDAIDTVREVHATPVLLTPKTIEESKRTRQ